MKNETRKTSNMRSEVFRKTKYAQNDLLSTGKINNSRKIVWALKKIKMFILTNV